jgi:aryl-alcohol dehydrogenase-like predicted oxidoreductase
MEFRHLGCSGLKVSVLSLGTMTFGGKGAFAKTGSTDIESARRQIDLCLDAGINLLDTADVYSAGLSEEILGQGALSRRLLSAGRFQGALPYGKRAERCRIVAISSDREAL